jgi:hypothetical protein
MAMPELKQRLLKIELARIGFRDAAYSDEQDAMLVNPPDKHVMRIKDDGVSYYAEHDLLVIHQIKPLADRVKEMVMAWEKAPAAPFEDLSHYRILAEYNNVVLAARDDSELGYGHGLHLTTWEYIYDRSGFHHGHYTTDYEAAKEDFAVRCGLVDKNKMFDETEMKLIRHGLVHLGANFPDLTAEQNTLLGKVVERIEMIVPEIEAREEMEREALVPDDGLEI